MSSGVVEWRQREVIEAIAAQVSEDMEISCKLVETDARKNLLRISKPQRRGKYRMILALYRLTSFVRRDGKTIEGHVGIPLGKKGGDYGFWIEVGSKTAAANPWLRPALLTNLDAIKALLGGE